MSFKCSVFGHRYGDTDVEREREEQGSEVVITIKETETCKRCGATRVVSENKEVTTLETPSDIVGDDIAGEKQTDDGATETRETTDADGPAAGTGTETEVKDVDPSTDDAELIDETAGADLGGATADPEPEPAEGIDQSTPTQKPESVTEEPDADEDDAVIIDEEESADGNTGREPGEWPDESDDDEDDWAPSTDAELRPVEDEQPDVKPTSSAVTVPEGEFYCPECEFVTDVESSSLRAGDFCPECHRGSLEHRIGEK